MEAIPLLGCLSKMFIKCKAHCKCSDCCESDCMVTEGDPDKLKRIDSKTSLNKSKKT